MVFLFVYYTPFWVFCWISLGHLVNFWSLKLQGVPSSNAGRRRATWSESEDDEPMHTQGKSRLERENSAGLEGSDGEIK